MLLCACAKKGRERSSREAVSTLSAGSRLSCVDADCEKWNHSERFIAKVVVVSVRNTRRATDFGTARI